MTSADAILASDAWRTEPETIYIAELRALVAAKPLTRNPLFATDNLGLHHTIQKGLSSSYTANCVLRRRFGDSWPRSVWIPTHVMPADGPSRLQPPPPPGPLREIEATGRSVALNNLGVPRPRTELLRVRSAEASVVSLTTPIHGTSNT